MLDTWMDMWHARWFGHCPYHAGSSSHHHCYVGVHVTEIVVVGLRRNFHVL